MERLETIEITVVNDNPDEDQWLRHDLRGEQARQWLRDHFALGDDPRAEQERAREMSLVLVAARDNQIDRACQQPGCEGCQVFERGFAWLTKTLPLSYQRAIREYEVLRLKSDLPLRVRHN